MRLLIAEDDAQLRDALVRGLRDRAFAVDAVADGDAAVVQAVVTETMSDAPSSCRDTAHGDPPVYNGRAFELPDITRPTDIATVTVTVSCDLDLSDLAALPLGHVQVSRTFTSPLDRYRGYQQ